MKIQIDYYKIGGIDMEKKEKTAFDILNKLQKDIPKKKPLSNEEKDKYTMLDKDYLDYSKKDKINKK